MASGVPIGLLLTLTYGPVVFTLSPSDTITLSDARVGSGAAPKSDTISLGDSLDRTWTALLSSSDTITLSDAPSEGVSRPLSDSLTLSDSKTLHPTPVESDSFSLSDARVATVVLYKDDSFTLSDVRAESGTTPRDDILTLTDVLARVFVANRVFTDTITLSDSKVYVRTNYSFSIIRTSLLLSALTRHHYRVSFPDSARLVMS